MSPMKFALFDSYDGVLRVRSSVSIAEDETDYVSKIRCNVGDL